ncbi:uncharacterized protein LOC108486287 [Gossypium arboreum]|uniref:Small ribosomal subunit protein uS15c n=1 Tax=Gossypium arboreum TaxID=29729 RepID=A0ABR0PQR5_GOSAR|nr:uncharacterized protein LOC108486287 [Gossypium arboreum]KAK5826771.1 hypothetical protein PVK06_021703 [Gossypium arboreum]
MALLLARSRCRSLANPSLLHLFSTSSNDPNNDNATANGNHSANNPPSVSSYFGDVKTDQHQQRPRSPTNPSTPNSKPMSVSASLREIRKNLSEFRRRSAGPSPAEPISTPSQSQPHISFQELFKRNASAKQGESTESPNGFGTSGKRAMENLKNSLRHMKQNSEANNNVEGRSGPLISLSAFKNDLKLKPSADRVVSPVIGGTSTELPASIFEREMKGKAKGGETAMRTEFVRMYGYEELGQRLKELRPPEKEGGFSLQELNERLKKLRAIEEKETDVQISGVNFAAIRDGLTALKTSDEEKQKNKLAQKVDILDLFGRTPEFMLHPPKEHLVEKYFHPDNMSSAEKMKIELAKVRDEFKMSESDCGSARVQVAQLTTKIKHLSSVLHKKDKHSRKGLQAMVQKRKKLLKYLRRTDWDSYCFVLLKLGLRDTADSKNY